MNIDSFKYEISIQDGYILDVLSGEFSEQGMTEATNALLSFADKTNTRKVLYDASQLRSPNADMRKKSLVYFKQVSNEMDKLASYIPNKRGLIIARFMSLLINISNWQTFNSKEKAIDWLRAT